MSRRLFSEIYILSILKRGLESILSSFVFPPMPLILRIWINSSLLSSYFSWWCVFIPLSQSSIRLGVKLFIAVIQLPLLLPTLGVLPRFVCSDSICLTIVIPFTIVQNNCCWTFLNTCQAPDCL